MLWLPDRWVWDSWLVDDGATYHLFFLQAPRSLGEQVRRHEHATVGHATSTDLVGWTDHGECLGPRGGAWDDRAIWTGSVVAAHGRWWMFYTGLSATSGQRIGLAVSDDLHAWERVGDGPVVDADPRWYDDQGGTWRDPLVLADPDGDGWHMLITAAAPGVADLDAGVIGYAHSPDLRTWTVGPPRTRPGAGFRHLEVPHSVVIDGRPVLVVSCHPNQMRRSGPLTGTWSMPGPGLLGPWDAATARPFTADPALFAAPLVRARDGGWVILGFRNLEFEGGDGLTIGDPILVTVDDDGYLVSR